MPVRTAPDACPGVFAPHDAADGALARVRLPGGVIAAAALRVVADCADELGDGRVHLTSRGNLQLRGLFRGPALAERLAAAGLLPSATHERVRNVLASPLAGITGGLADVRGLAAALDRELCARPALAGLPGRILFAIDDGRGDVAAEEPDLCWRATSASAGVLLVAGVAVGEIPVGDAVAALRDAAEAFLALRAAGGRPGSAGAAGPAGAAGSGAGPGVAAAWRVAELPDAPARIAAALRLPPVGASGALVPLPPSPQVTGALPGPVRRADGGVALVVAPVLGELTAAQVRLLADVTDAGSGGPADGLRAVVTPWRTIVLPDLHLPPAVVPAGQHPRPAGHAVRRDEPAPSPRERRAVAVAAPPNSNSAPLARVDLRAAGARAAHPPAPPSTAGLDPAVREVVARLADAGLLVAPGPAVDLSACAGRPGCVKALADVRADARAALVRLPGGRVHVSGCARRCGAPRTAHVDAVALVEGGYLVDGTWSAEPVPFPAPAGTGARP